MLTRGYMRAILVLTVLTSLIGACAVEEGYTPIGDDESSDTICTLSDLDLQIRESIEVPLQPGSGLSMEGDFTITDASPNGLIVDTDAYILQVPAGQSLHMAVSENDLFDVSSDVVFFVDLRLPGEEYWVELGAETQGQDITWFNEFHLAVEQSSSTVSGMTYLLCSARSAIFDNLPYDDYSAAELADGYELRIRPFLISGFADLADSYTYSVYIETY